MTAMPPTPHPTPPSAIHPISRERHGPRRWQRPAHYLHAAAQPLAPLASFEAPVAAVHLPMAFVVQGARPVLVAVLGAPPAANWCVAPDGRWTGPYIPAIFRAAPFALHRVGDGAPLLCIDEGVGQVALADAPAAPATATAQGEEAFFAADGTPTPMLAQVYGFLTRIDKGREAMERACDALAQHGLLVPWPVVFNTQAGEQPVNGLLRVDEAALRQLPAEALHTLMQKGALALAYSQLVSIQHFGLLAQWASAHAATPAPAPVTAPQTSPAPDLDLVQKFFEPGAPDTIQFNW